jgi:hypothetical protein
MKPEPEEANKILADKAKTENEMLQKICVPNPIAKSQTRGRRPAGNSQLILMDQNSA